MPITGPNARAITLLCAAALCGPLLCGAPEESTPVNTIAQLASALSRNDAVAALEVFDSGMKDYASIESALGALVAQSDILCAIDIVSEQENDGVHSLDVDWYMQLKSQAAAGPSERRRERVSIAMKKVRGKWRITALTPVSILSTVTIH